MAQIQIRPASQEDYNYLRTNFSQAYRHSAYCGGTSTEVLKQLLDPLLATWTTLIAAPPDDPSVILAWLLYHDAKTVAWIHVRPGLRRKGIANQLLRHAGIEKGAITVPFIATKLEGVEGSFSSLTRAHGYDLRYRPHLSNQVAFENARDLAEVLA